MNRCFDLDMLRQLDAAPIAPAYCAVDDVLYRDLCPQLRWTRAGTFTTGSTHCDFCFEHGAQRQPTARAPLPQRRTWR